MSGVAEVREVVARVLHARWCNEPTKCSYGNDDWDEAEPMAEALEPLIVAREAAAARSALLAAADVVEGLRVHVDVDPNSTCPDGCGWFNYAANKLRDRAEGAL